MAIVSLRVNFRGGYRACRGARENFYREASLRLSKTTRSDIKAKSSRHYDHEERSGK